jgi:hypothetical protein
MCQKCPTSSLGGAYTDANFLKLDVGKIYTILSKTWELLIHLSQPVLGK